MATKFIWKITASMASYAAREALNNPGVISNETDITDRDDWETFAITDNPWPDSSCVKQAADACGGLERAKGCSFLVEAIEYVGSTHALEATVSSRCEDAGDEVDV